MGLTIKMKFIHNQRECLTFSLVHLHKHKPSKPKVQQNKHKAWQEAACFTLPKK